MGAHWDVYSAADNRDFTEAVHDAWGRLVFRVSKTLHDGGTMMMTMMLLIAGIHRRAPSRHDFFFKKPVIPVDGLPLFARFASVDRGAGMMHELQGPRRATASKAGPYPPPPTPRRSGGIGSAQDPGSSSPNLAILLTCRKSRWRGNVHLSGARLCAALP